MKVVYVTIERQIRKAIESAAANGREISHIELNRFEAAQLAMDIHALNFPEANQLPTYSVKSGDHYYGVRLEVKE